MDKAYFAGGCFWCMVKPFDTYDGIEKVTSGYMGGNTPNPDYESVKTGKTGHLEAVEIIYDKAVFPYEKLLEIYFSIIDPCDPDGQFHDRGPQYRTAVFYQNEVEKNAAEQYIANIQQYYKYPVVTAVRPYEPFYAAEGYHQDFYKKEPEIYAQEQLERKAYKEKNNRK